MAFPVGLFPARSLFRSIIIWKEMKGRGKKVMEISKKVQERRFKRYGHVM